MSDVSDVVPILADSQYTLYVVKPATLPVVRSIVWAYLGRPYRPIKSVQYISRNLKPNVRKSDKRTAPTLLVYLPMMQHGWLHGKIHWDRGRTSS